MKKTAVEWLQDCLNIHFSFEQKMQFEGLFQQALEMEKQQIIDSISNANKSNNRNVSLNPEQYYNETFRNE
jgi:hypothetical protein